MSQGNSAASWNTTPRSGPGRATAPPPTRSSPPDGASNPAIRLSRVDLPQPDGPSSATNSPSATCRSIWSSACTGVTPG
ncbi:Uncharacterised protein [Bordetella pertussis]|nr:Uncharacterised protein [Bordetella pertussis]